MQAAFSDWLFLGELEHFPAIQNNVDNDKWNKLSTLCTYSLPEE